MKLVRHIAYWYNEGRLRSLNTIIEEMNKFEIEAIDIFIHCNVIFDKSRLIENKKGKTDIILWTPEKCPKGINCIGHYLTWNCRDLMKSQYNDYDIFMYTEDDIVFYKENLEYWLEYKDMCKEHNCNLIFVRRETDNIKLSDISKSHKYTDIININGAKFTNIGANYYAGWIYDKNEFKIFTNSDFFNLEWCLKRLWKKGIYNYLRVHSAYGLHNRHFFHYKYNSLVLLDKDNMLDKRCLVTHLHKSPSMIPENHHNWQEFRKMLKSSD